MKNLMVDINAMSKQGEAELKEAKARLYSIQRQSQAMTQNLMVDTDAMVRAQETYLREAYRKTNEMALASQIKPRDFYKTFELN